MVLRRLDSLVVSVVYTTLVHTFFYATLFHETGLHCDQQLVKHVYRLMYERDAEVGYFFIVHALWWRHTLS